MSIYRYSARSIDGELISLDTYRGQVCLIVNTASQCGFTPQYQELQELYTRYRERGFTVLGFPCNQFGNQEPGSSDEIRQFCQRNYGVTFPLFAKVKVKGKEVHPLFAYLTKESPGLFSKEIKWNFTKFLVNREGEVVDRFAPITKPSKIAKIIEQYL